MCETCRTARKVLELLALEAARQGFDVEEVKRYDSFDEYQQAIYGAARAFWKDGSRGGFITRMREIIKFGLRSAYREGAASMGVPEDELSADELKDRDESIKWEIDALDKGIVEFMDEQAVGGATLDDIKWRLDLWANRWKEIYTRAQVMVGKDAPLEWVMDVEKENCTSCLKLNGIVKRASFWQKAGVLPRIAGARYLVCGGWKCGCELRATNKPIKRGRLPKLP